MQGKLLGIFIAEQKSIAMKAVDSVETIAGKGIFGDRYCSRLGTFSKTEKARDITLIEIEAVWALKRDYQIDVEPRELRRNLLTEGIALNHFVGRSLFIGGVILEGIELCEPCGYLSNMLNLPLKDALKHRGGLRCRIVHGGELALMQNVRGVA